MPKFAGVLELVDNAALEAAERKLVQVRVLSPALKKPAFARRFFVWIEIPHVGSE